MLQGGIFPIDPDATMSPRIQENITGAQVTLRVEGTGFLRVAAQEGGHPESGGLEKPFY
jgi:hypothetical protein